MLPILTYALLSAKADAIFTAKEGFYLVSSRDVYSVTGLRTELKGRLNDGESLIGTDQDSRPLAVTSGFRELDPKMSSLWQADGPQFLWDISREILGVRQGVFFTSREGVVYFDYQRSGAVKTVVVRHSANLSAIAYRPCVSPNREIAACCFRKQGQYGVITVNMNDGKQKVFGGLKLDAPLLQAEFLTEDQLVLLAGKVPRSASDATLIAPGHTNAGCYRLTVSTGKIEKLSSVSLKQKESYLARDKSGSVVVLCRSGIVTVPTRTSQRIR